MRQFPGFVPGIMEVMQEQVDKLPDGPPPKTNPGWFQPGDRRINREGRPRGSKAGLEGGAPAECAPRTDRLMLLVVTCRDLAFRISQCYAPWIANLPPDFEIVTWRVDAARDTVAFIIRSKEFPRIVRGSPIPEFVPELHGLKWRRRG